jgi:hypothetical protein
MEPGGREWKTVEAVELSPYDFHKLLCNLSIAIYIGPFFLPTSYKIRSNYHCFKSQVQQLIATS